MIQSTPPRQTYPPKGFLDQSASMTSSTITFREKFARRTDEKSVSRRSVSRSSAQKSEGNMDISKFYTKMSKRSSENNPSPPRKNIFNRQQDAQKNKKRSPTPVPGQVKKKQKEKNSDELDEQLESDLAICELQKKLQSEQQEKKLYIKRVAVFEREIKVKLVRIQQLQQTLVESQQRQVNTAKKLQEYQSLITINQNNLNQAKSSLEKLKNTIKQNKYAQIESDNARLKQQNLCLKQQVEKMEIQAEILMVEIQSLSNQVLFLRKNNEELTNSQRIQEKNREIETLQQMIQTSKSQKQHQLEQLILKGNREKGELMIRVQKLQMKLNFVNRKKCHELDAVRDAKNEIISKLRIKISTIFAQNYSIRAQLDQLKAKSKEKTSISTRKNHLLLQTQADQLFRLDLSP